MESETIDATQMVEAVESLRREVTRLSQRMAALEQVLPDNVRRVAWKSDEASGTEELNEEIVMAIGAAVAAYLGKKPHIRQIRLLRSDTWTEQGRVTILASHAVALHRG